MQTILWKYDFNKYFIYENRWKSMLKTEEIPRIITPKRNKRRCTFESKSLLTLLTKEM